MEDIRTERLSLHAIDVAEGERIASRSAGPMDTWAQDFPFEGDLVAVGMFLRASVGETFGEQQPFGYYRITRLADGIAIGGIGFKGKPVADCGEIGYGLAPSVRGQSYAAEAILAILGMAHELKLERVIASTTIDNISSQRSLARASFRLVSANAQLCHYEVIFE